MSNKREVIFISIARAFTAASFSVSIPFLNIYLYSEREIPMKVIGFMVGLSSLLGAFSRVPSGYIGDRLGCKNLMVLGLLSRFFAFLFFTIFIIFNVTPVLFLFGFVLNSLGFSLFALGSDSYVGIYLPEKERPSSYGIIRVGTNLGFAIGPAIGGYLASFSYTLLFTVSSLLTFIVLPLIQFGVKCPKGEVLSNKNFLLEIKSILDDKIFFYYIISIFLLFSLAGQMISTLSVYAKEKGLSNTLIGYLFTINGASVVILQIFFTKLSESIGFKNSLIFGILLYILGYFLFSFASNFYFFALCVFIFTAGEMLSLPIVTTFGTIYAKKGKENLYLGFLGLAEGLGWASAPFYGGIILDFFIKIPVLMWGIIIIPGFISFIIVTKVLKNEKVAK
ncbi:MAG: MFS transporter [Candidatus Hydrothermales bacterium]